VKPKQKKLVAAVTGASGLVGRCIVNKLLESGWGIKALTRRDSFPDMQDVTIVKGDINDKAALQELLRGVDAVFHCVAELYDEAIMRDVNVTGVKTLLSLLPLSSVRYFCYISSAGVIGPTKEQVITEETLCHPFNEYEKTKYEAEKLVVSSKLRTRICILRPTNVIGDTKKGVLRLPLRDNWRDRLTCFFKGKEGAHIIHAEDVAAASVFFINKPILKPEIFIISCDEDCQNTLSGVYSLVLKYLGKKNKNCYVSLPVIIPYLLRYLFKGASLHGNSRFSSQKIRNAGFTFSLGLERAVKDVCEQSKAKF